MMTKLNLNCGQDVRNGYLNIDKYQSDLPSDKYQSGNIDSLDWICDDTSVDEIIAINVLETIPFNQIEEVIKNWARKLSPGGTIKLSIIDLYIIAKLFVEAKISTQDFIGHLWGNNNQTKFSAINSSDLCVLLDRVGLNVTVKRYDGISFYLEATKT